MEFVITGDGSKTLYNPEIGEHYHSKHGALQESEHVFRTAGFEFLMSEQEIDNIRILEVGFGTGLNFLVTANYANSKGIKIAYCGIEAFPLSVSTICQTGYDEFISPELWSVFSTSYESFINNPREISPGVELEIAHRNVMEFDSENLFDLIYFDAFAALYQPEMWSDETISHVCSFIRTGGVFVTYAITGNLKRLMKRLGFSIEKVPGALGKREMLRAVKL